MLYKRPGTTILSIVQVRPPHPRVGWLLPCCAPLWLWLPPPRMSQTRVEPLVLIFLPFIGIDQIKWCQPLYCPRLGTLRWKGRLYVCSTVDRAEQFGADPEMFLLGVATLLHRCNIAIIYLSFVWMKTDISISKILMFRLPTLASILDAKAEEEQSEKCEVEHEHKFDSSSYIFEPKL